MSGVLCFAVSTSVLPSKDQFVQSGVNNSRKSTTEFEALPFAKGQFSDEGTHSLKSRCFVWERERWMKASTKWLNSFLSFEYVFTIVQECLGCCRISTSTRDVAGIRWCSANLRAQQEHVQTVCSWIRKKQVRTILKKPCISLLGDIHMHESWF